MPRFLSALTVALPMGLLLACEPATSPTPLTPTTPVTPTPTPQADFKPIADKLTLPTTIDYHSKEGSLKDLVYRSTFTYDTQNRLTAITEQQVGYPGSNSSWVWFTYTDNRLTQINLKRIGYNYDAPVASEEQQPAQFELTYNSSQIEAKLLINGKQVQATTLAIDERGLPVKSSLSRLYFTPSGNLDQIAASQNDKSIDSEILEQRYDTNPTVFSQVRELQLLDALLSMVNRRGIATGIVGLGSSLNSNNLVYTKRKNCWPQHGCREIDENHIQIIESNTQHFPTQIDGNMEALGRLLYKIEYKRVDG